MEEALWNGEKPKNLPLSSRVKTIEACGRTVHQFRVDEEEKTIISTHQKGGLLVSSVDTQEVLWSLPEVSLSHGIYLWSCLDLLCL